jgi:hypothetical protein
MSEISSWNKEELYDVIAALSATIRSLTNEIRELQGILLYQEPGNYQVINQECKA